MTEAPKRKRGRPKLPPGTRVRDNTKSVRVPNEYLSVFGDRLEGVGDLIKVLRHWRKDIEKSKGIDGKLSPRWYYTCKLLDEVQATINLD